MNTVTVPCSCPGSPHPEDTITLAPVLDPRIGAAAMAALKTAPSTIPDVEAALAGVFVAHGVREWTFVDEKKEPLPVTPENIAARLTWASGGMEVAEKANELYAGDLFTPFLRRRSKDSSSGPTDDSTSPTPPPGSGTDSSDKPSLHAVSGGKRSEARAS